MALLEDGAWQGKLWTGPWTDGSGGTYTAVEPATGDALGEVGKATPADVARRRCARGPRRSARGRPCRSSSAPPCCAGPATC